MSISRSTKLTFVKKWQRRLRLADWNIDYKEKRWKKKPHLGKTIFDRHEMEATVTIKKGLSTKVWKITALHELMHLRFPFHAKADTWSEQEIERGVELTARALLGGLKGGSWK